MPQVVPTYTPISHNSRYRGNGAIPFNYYGFQDIFAGGVNPDINQGLLSFFVDGVNKTNANATGLSQNLIDNFSTYENCGKGFRMRGSI